MKTADSLQIKHTPGCLWLAGGFFFIIGAMLLYGILGGFSNYDTIKIWEIAVGLFISLSMISVGIWMLFANPTMLTEINKRKKTISILEKGFFRRKKTDYKFSEVSNFELIEEKDSDDDSFFYITLNTTRSEKVKISSTGIQVESYAQEINEEINRYLNKEKFLDK